MLSTVLYIFIKFLELILVFLVLFFLFLMLVPIRYRLSGSFMEKRPEFKARFSWLFGYLRADMQKEGKAPLDGTVKLLFITIFRMNNEEEDGL